jgi:hypothetical protein
MTSTGTPSPRNPRRRLILALIGLARLMVVLSTPRS